MKKKAKKGKKETAPRLQPTAFELVMNFQSDLRVDAGLSPLPHWKKSRETPEWTKNVCRKLRNTVLKPILKLRPKRKFSWRNYGRGIGIIERYKTFLAKDVPRDLKEDGLDKIGKKKWAKIQPLLGEEELRQYYLKNLELPANDKTPMLKLFEMGLERQLMNLEMQKQNAFIHLSNQNAKTVAIFLKGMGEGDTTFLNEDGQFSGDDRRADIHLELIAWQHDIEKMRKSVLPKTRNDLFREIKKLPEFKNKTQDWFNDVCKDVKLNGWKRDRSWQFSQP